MKVETLTLHSCDDREFTVYIYNSSGWWYAKIKVAYEAYVRTPNYWRRDELLIALKKDGLQWN